METGTVTVVCLPGQVGHETVEMTTSVEGCCTGVVAGLLIGVVEGWLTVCTLLTGGETGFVDSGG